MARYRLSADIAAPIDMVFDLWTNLERAPEWIEGLTKVTDATGPYDQVGTRYTSWFGKMRSPSEVLEAERPRRIRIRFGSWLLGGENEATLETIATGTRLTQEFRTEGIIPAIAAWVFAHGSFKGSFRGEIETFVRIVEREAAESS